MYPERRERSASTRGTRACVSERALEFAKRRGQGRGAQRWRTTSTAGAASSRGGATGIRRWVAAATRTRARGADRSLHMRCVRRIRCPQGEACMNTAGRRTRGPQQWDPETGGSGADMQGTGHTLCEPSLAAGCCEPEQAQRQMPERAGASNEAAPCSAGPRGGGARLEQGMVC